MMEESQLQEMTNEELLDKLNKVGTLLGWMEFGRNGADVTEFLVTADLIKQELLRRLNQSTEMNDG